MQCSARKLSFLLFAVTLSVSPFFTASRAASTLEYIVQNGSVTNHLNFAFFAEGYTQAEEAKFYTDVQVATEALFTAKPFFAYTNFFNSIAIFIASAESGSDHPAQNIFRNTYFNSRFDSNGKSYEISIPPNQSDTNYDAGLGKVYQLLAEHNLAGSIPIVIVNDPEYGGSGGAITIASTHKFSANLVLHELGHSLGRLWEEYEGAPFGQVNAVNNTSSTNFSSIPWNYWIDSQVPIPTPESDQYANVVGLFQGAAGYTSGTYRPKLDCRMRSIDAEFCEVCSEALILSIYQRTKLWPAWTPSSSEVALNSTSQDFRFLKVPAHTNYTVNWYLDGILTQTGVNSRFTPKNITSGSHILKAVASDATKMVRRDPLNLLVSSNEWKITVSGPLLDIRLDGSTVVLNWDETSGASILQTAFDNLPQSSWTIISDQITRVGTHAELRVPTLNQHQYFRLVR